MDWPYELQIGWRYTRSGRAGRRNGFISFISAVSMAGIALGVAALIIVLSVMNGFQKEVRDRMLSVIAHVEVHAAGDAALPDWRIVAAQARKHPQVIGAAPFVAAQGLVSHGEAMRGTLVRGISPADEASVTPLAAKLRPEMDRLVPGGWGVLLGVELARSLGVREGDKVALITPGGQVTPAGVIPRLKQLTVAGTFETGHWDYDNGLALMHLDDAARLFRVEGPTGVQLRLKDVQAARRVADELGRSFGAGYELRDWTRSNRAWFDAVQVEKRLMFIILTLIVAVAAFNLVSTLVMTVTDKRADIAILRTLGASPRSVMGVFMVQGAASGPSLFCMEPAHIFPTLLQQISAQHFSEWMAVAGAIVYLVLAARGNPWCWGFGIVSCAFWAYADFTYYKLYIDGFLQLFYIGISFLGFYQWKYGGENKEALPVSRMRPVHHAWILAGGLLLSATLGALFSKYTIAAYSYLNTLTTVFAVITTFLAIRKKLENWIYWFFIDCINVFVFWQSGGYLIAMLFIAYLVLVVAGFLSWRKKLPAASDS